MGANSTFVEFVDQHLSLPRFQQLFNVPRMPLGKNMRALRESLGWTLDELAERSGVDLGTISALEVRESSRSKYAGQLAKALGVGLEQLLADELITERVVVSGNSSRTSFGLWPFTAGFEDYQLLSNEKKRQLDSMVSGFIRGALPADAGKSSSSTKAKSAA